jgi:hypothetical protein
MVEVKESRQMIKASDSLKRQFFKRKFVKSLEEGNQLLTTLNTYTVPPQYINMFDSAGTIDRRISELQKILITKFVLAIGNKIISAYYGYVKRDRNISFELNSRKFLFAWMIVSFPETVLGKQKDAITNPVAYPDDVYFVSKKLIYILNTYRLNPYSKIVEKQLIKSFNEYSNAFHYFKQRDQIAQSHELVGQYVDVSETLKLIEESTKYTEQDKIASITEVKKTQDTIFGYLKVIDNTVIREDLDLFIRKERARSKNLERSQLKTLVSDISNKKFIYMKKIIDEIKQSFNKLNGRKIPLTNPDGSSVSIDDILDSDYIVTQFIRETFSKTKVITYGTHLKKIINGIQAPSAEEETNRKWEQLINSEINESELFGNILFFVLSEIRDVKESIMNFLALSSVK